MPELVRLTLTLPEEAGEDAVDMLSALLAVNVAHGWEEQSLPTGETRCVVHSGHEGWCGELAETLRQALPELRIERDVVKEQNWAEAWKEFFTPVEGGGHFLVLAPWMTKEREETKRIPLLIEPKMAFGTGHHATTALCLGAISSLFSAGKIRAGMQFLDLGTGSGILGIAAAKLGLTGKGFDIDVVAVENALENRALNHVSPENFFIAKGSIEDAGQGFDLVVANILAAPLKELAPAIVKAMKPAAPGAPASVLVLSGLLESQADGVEECYVALGLPKAERSVQGEWAALTFEAR